MRRTRRRTQQSFPAGGAGDARQAAPYAQLYAYDKYGNITQRQGWGGWNASYTATYTGNRRDGHSYDAAGNLVNDGGQAFTYDVNNKLVSSSWGLQQSYDGDGQRVKKTENGGTTYYLRSSVLSGQVICEIDGGGVWQKGYVYLGGQMLAIQYAGTVSFVHQDPITKSQRLTDTSGNVIANATIELDPFGGETSAMANGSGRQSHVFTSYERDGTAGMDEAGARKYHGWWSRFDQPDPYDGSYNMADPQSFNRYSYVQNDPVNFVDPSGLDDTPVTGSYTQTTVGGVLTSYSATYNPLTINVTASSNTPYLGGSFGGVSSHYSHMLLPLDPIGGGDGRGRRTPDKPPQTAPQQPPQDDCHRFADMVQEMANNTPSETTYHHMPGGGSLVSTPNIQSFVDTMATRFTGASGSSSARMLANPYSGAAPARIGNGGFRAEFDDGSNLQVRHYVGGLISGYDLGSTLALRQMNSRENSNVRADRIDMALNAVSTRHGGSLNAGNFRQLAEWIRRDICGQ